MFRVGGFVLDTDDIHIRILRPRPFDAIYQCYSVAMFPGHERQDVENGGKIFLPPSALAYLTQLKVAFPMLFKLTNVPDNRYTHCGVLEFVAEEGKMYIPYWMMRQLMIDEGSLIRVESATLPVANFAKFEPQTADFLEITNPKAMLENALRNYACLTTGDVIAIRYNDRIYELRVLETRPGEGVNIIECDMDVDFAKPIDYVEPKRRKTEEEAEEPEAGADFIPFIGTGQRVDGKDVPSTSTVGSSSQVVKRRRGVPDYNFQIGQLNFCRNMDQFNSDKDDSKTDKKSFEPFGGSGNTLNSKPAKD